MYNENMALKAAVSSAKNSNCKSKRSVVIFHRTGGVISEGWNAPPKPFICDGSDACRANCAKTAVHAEQAALMKYLQYPNEEYPISECEMLHVKIIDGEAVISEKPSCWQCSKLILASGLKSMWLYQAEGFVEYTAEDFHKQTLINCELLVEEL